MEKINKVEVMKYDIELSKELLKAKIKELEIVKREIEVMKKLLKEKQKELIRLKVLLDATQPRYSDFGGI